MINQGSKLQFLLVFMVDKMKILFAVISLLGLQNVFSAENIYEDAIAHFIEDVIEHQELSFSEGNRDSIYHFSLFFESSEIFETNNIPSTICGYKIVQMRMDDFKTYLDTCSRRRGVIFSIERMNFCKTCDAKFSVLIVACHADYRDVDLLLHEVRYDYKCKRNTFKYRYCASGGASHLWKNTYLRRKGLKR